MRLVGGSGTIAWMKLNIHSWKNKGPDKKACSLCLSSKSSCPSGTKLISTFEGEGPFQLGLDFYLKDYAFE